ncbi:NmrA family NAD(P)-binding protein [Candidatus Bathyarchaeota archaeon]|nr:NmrA family NAD(P)-binding protein [Candidatus Bathyarchaeota archaeon]
MSPTKLITVIGATGNQGGSVVNTFLDTPGWKVRGITRNPSSAKAKALSARGVEVVKADMDHPSSLPPAFAGSHAIFAVSDFWGIYGDPENEIHRKAGQPLNEWTAVRETDQLKSVIDAAAAVQGLERFILSSISDATKWSKGKYTNVFHFDSKANAETYGREIHPDLWAKTSVFHAGLFISNFLWSPMAALKKVFYPPRL